MSPHRSLLPSTERRTKIVCTLGPASRTPETIDALVRAGMNVVRINCSHGDHAEHAATIAAVREVARRYDVYIPVLLDLAGPKMRIGTIEGGEVTLRPGDAFTLTADDVVGNGERVAINYPGLLADVRPGDRILMGDGEIELEVASSDGRSARCRVVVGGQLKSNKGINAPGVKLRERVPTEKDREDIRFGVDQGVDWFALSFVRGADEIRAMRELLDSLGSDTPVVAKIEKREALDRLDEVLEAADAVMIARGDLGLELPIPEVPLVQKDVLRAARAAGRPVIIATQMLESMVVNPRPTRAEATDVANAVMDGTDAVMLSAETAAGAWPVEAVRTMASLALASEARVDYADRFHRASLETGRTIPRAIAHAACYTAIETGSRVIVCCTRSGQTARFVSMHRPPAKIAVVSPHEETLNRTMLYWNTHPIRIPLEPHTDAMIRAARRAVLEAGLAARGERVVIVAGVPVDVPGTTNMIKVDVL